MEVTIREEKIAHIPCLHLSGTIGFRKAKPLVIIYHGFMTAKDSNLQLGYLLAREGLRVIMPDAPFHGDRISEPISRPQLESQFYEMLQQAIREADSLKVSLERSGLIQPDKIGMIGVSMGGYITFGALSRHSWLTTAVSLMGNPDWVHSVKYYSQGRSIPHEKIVEKINAIRPISPLELTDRYAGKPLLFWHGEEDKRVPIDGVRALYGKLLPFYEDAPEKLRLIAIPNHGHYVTNDGIRQTIDWMIRYLAPA